MASLVLTDSSQLTSDGQHLEVSCELSLSTKEVMGPLYLQRVNIPSFILKIDKEMITKHLEISRKVLDE
uniref:Uncharacterized protein n=1 Tax=Timema poppense TaxID=170557 RepID=A0A7R9DTL4_TIMPO|nr:unnamed protein product [Timema poppensis]